MSGGLVPPEVEEIYRGIKEMKIRGAGRIARYAAKALSLAAESYSGDSVRDFIEYMERAAKYIGSARPTAVSLPNAVNYVMSRLRKSSPKTVEEAKSIVRAAAKEFIEYSEKAVGTIGRIGAGLFEAGDVVMTHCHSTAAVAVIVEAYRRGKVKKVYVKETRPAFQGMVTARALADAGLDVTVIPDSAARVFMKKVDKVVVGADTVMANGAVVNKIGTSLLALIAREFGVDFYVAAETYKFSPYTLRGERVVIEVRSPTEVVDESWLRAHPSVKVFNPVFDVTPPEFITAIVTEFGVIPPQVAAYILIKTYGFEL